MNVEFTNEVREQDLQRLINQLWKLLPMREHNEDWQTHLKIVTEEISGLLEIYKDKVDSLVLLSKLRGLPSEECNDFMIYRRTVFRCIELLSQVLR